MTLSASIEKEVTKIGKNWKKKKLQKLSYKLQFIITGRFRASSLSNLVKNPFEQIHKTEHKYGSDIKSEMCGIKYKDYKSCLDTRIQKS